MHDLDNYLPPPATKGKSYEAANWKLCDQELAVSEILVAIKDGLPSSMQDKLYDHQEDYNSLTHEDWCDLLSTIEVKDDRKRSSTQIKNITSTREASLSDSDGSVRIPRKKKARLGAGFLHSNKVPNNKAPKNHSNQRHCVIFKKSGIPERKYILQSYDDCFEKLTNQKTIKGILIGPMESRA